MPYIGDIMQQWIYNKEDKNPPADFGQPGGIFVKLQYRKSFSQCKNPKNVVLQTE